MGRHSIAYIEQKQRSSAARHGAYVGRVGVLAVALGIGTALAAGVGTANADSDTGKDADHATHSAPGPSAGASADRTPSAKTPDADEAGKPDEAAKPVKPQPDNKTASETKPADDRPSDDATDLESTAPKAATPDQRDQPDRAKAPTPSRKSRPAPEPKPKNEPVATDHPAAARAEKRNVPADSVERPDAGVETARPIDTVQVKSLTTNARSAAIDAAPSQIESATPTAIIKAAVTRLTAANSTTTSSSGNSPAVLESIVLGALQLVRRELEQSTTSATTTRMAAATVATAPAVPNAKDQVATEYGNIGKWMLQPSGQIANYGGQKYQGKTLLEPVNVIIVDPTSTSAAAAKNKLTTAMTSGGFPAQTIHSGGFKGIIDGKTYQQQPTGFLEAFSNNSYTQTNDHGRIFGPDPVETSGGYVWTGAFSTESVSSYFFGIPVHSYVSSNAARAALAAGLIASGKATYGGTVDLQNSYNTGTTTTGDHDGKAVVLILK
ncbi:MAG: hypothetical protein U0Q20_11650 [Mycobacterium sp.]|nr:hypothetical protein [Mycobacterium sp.]